MAELNSVTHAQGAELLAPSEHEMQKAFFERVDTDPRTKNLVIYAVPNFTGHFGTQLQRIRAGKRLKEEGRRKGALDINVDEPRRQYHSMRIEMKQPGQYPSDEQRWFIAALTSRGFHVVVCRSADEAWDELMAYLGFAS